MIPYSLMSFINWLRISASGMCVECLEMSTSTKWNNRFNSWIWPLCYFDTIRVSQIAFISFFEFSLLVFNVFSLVVLLLLFFCKFFLSFRFFLIFFVKLGFVLQMNLQLTKKRSYRKFIYSKLSLTFCFGLSICQLFCSLFVSNARKKEQFE